MIQKVLCKGNMMMCLSQTLFDLEKRSGCEFKGELWLVCIQLRPDTKPRPQTDISGGKYIYTTQTLLFSIVCLHALCGVLKNQRDSYIHKFPEKKSLFYLL